MPLFFKQSFVFICSLLLSCSVRGTMLKKKWGMPKRSAMKVAAWLEVTPIASVTHLNIAAVGDIGERYGDHMVTHLLEVLNLVDRVGIKNTSWKSMWLESGLQFDSLNMAKLDDLSAAIYLQGIYTVWSRSVMPLFSYSLASYFGGKVLQRLHNWDQWHNRWIVLLGQCLRMP